MDDNELGRQVGTAMREALPEHADLTVPSTAIRDHRPTNLPVMSARPRRSVLIAAAAASIVLVTTTTVVIKIAISPGAGVQAPPGAVQHSGPNSGSKPTRPTVRATVDTLTFRHPEGWISVPPGGPPTPGLSNIAEYLTNAAVAPDCRVRASNGMTPIRCNPPVSVLSPDQVLVWISEGGYTSDAIKPTRIVDGHRTSLQYGQATSLPTASLDCPTGTTHYLHMTIDDRLATDETSRYAASSSTVTPSTPAPTPPLNPFRSR